MSGESDTPQDRPLTINQVAAALCTSKMTVYRLISSGQLDAERTGRTYRVYSSTLERYLAEHRVEPDRP